MKRTARYLIFATAGFGLWISANAQPPAKDTPDLQRVERLRKEITLLNLISGLEITPEQTAKILEQAKASEAVRTRMKEDAAAAETELLPVLEKIKAERMENQDVTPDAAREFHRIQDPLKSEAAEAEKNLKERIGIVKDILKPNQVYQLRKFKPCIIPPKGESKIGQVENAAGVVKTLEKIRGLAALQYERRKEALAEKMIEALKRHYPREAAEADAAKLRRDLLSILDEARSLADVDFQIRKESLAEKISGLVKPAVNLDDLDAKIRNLLLSPEAIPVLEAKLKNG